MILTYGVKSDHSSHLAQGLGLSGEVKFHGKVSDLLIV